MSEWIVFCKQHTQAPTLTVKRLYKGRNKITRGEDVISILRHPGLCEVNAQAAVDSGLVAASVVAELGYDVVDAKTSEPVLAKDHFEMTKADPEPDAPEVDPIFAQMTRKEMLSWSERLSALGYDAGLKRRDSHDNFVIKISKAYNAAAADSKVLSIKNPVVSDA